MNSASLLARIARSPAVIVLTLASAGVQAHGSRGTEVDTACSAFNGTKPYTASGAFPNSCSLCHQENRSIRREPEWTWVEAGPDGEKNFCVVQGIIATPAADPVVSQGGTVALAARGLSPTSGVGAVSFKWSFSDGRPDLIGPAQNAVPMPNAGKVIVTLNTTDATSATDATPDQRTITVSATPTVGSADAYAVQSGNTLTVPAPGVLSNDTGTGKLTATRVTNVTHGALTLNANGGFDYTPNVGYAGSDSFTYTASNGVFTSVPATVTIDVTPAPPVASADRYSVARGQVLNVAALGDPKGVLSNDRGSGILSATLVTNVTRGTLTLRANGGFVYRPRKGYTGVDSFAYMVRNSAGTSAPVTVTLSVGACTDKDGDGYSSEGGDCGPIDCNDQNPAVNPGAKEICSNQVDDDCNRRIDDRDPSCNGKDCIGNLLTLADQVRIDTAIWNAGQRALVVTGSNAVPGANVQVLDPVSGTLLGAATVDGVDGPGTWKVVHFGLTEAPCRVKAEINGASGQRSVNGAPATCSGLPSCGE